MIHDLTAHFAYVLYSVDADQGILIPIAYFLSFIVAVLLREFTHGLVKYVLAILFVLSFSFAVFVMMIDYSPWQFILVGIIIFGVISGLWRWINDIVKDLKKSN